MKTGNMLLAFMQQLKSKLKQLLQKINRKDDDSFDNPYLIF
ncbi:hypothetical protein IQ13_3965 [Lacibacter cauensis]|uniref:Uncharacterized protein n=1 Tax=Lacibacter cauensis TaxID=510947 RepID=A0A562SAT2_9BACT|nr:hypothetical protein [Lacibacter cauensis]TWI78283.1 hypothetical protein IQ13_3965 [Lacibacter cauensis]